MTHRQEHDLLALKILSFQTLTFLMWALLDLVKRDVDLKGH